MRGDDLERLAALEIPRDFIHRGESMNKLRQFLRKEDGAAAIEYGLLAGLIAVAIVVAVGLIGTSLNTVYGYVSTALAAIGGP